MKKLKKLTSVFLIGMVFMNVTEEVDSGENEKKIIDIGCYCDISEECDNVQILSQKSDFIVECKIIANESYAKEGGSIYTDYTLEILKVFKGNNIDEGTVVVMNALGGVMTGEEYEAQVDDDKSLLMDDDFSDYDMEDIQIEMFANDVRMPTDNSELIAYLKWNENENKYYPVGLYKGLFVENKEGMYERVVNEERSDTMDENVEVIEEETVINLIETNCD